jgi:hypothetical protein
MMFQLSIASLEFLVKATGNGTRCSREYELDSGICYKPAWPRSYVYTSESRDTA